MPSETKTILIAGPTASGKSAYALELMRERGLENRAVIINADSMQVYRQLQILTARPSDKQMAQALHLLYGHRDVGEAYSVAAWLEDVKPVLEKVHGAGRIAIFVGGTGLYFRGLIEGLSPVPPLDEKIRQKWRQIALELRHGEADSKHSLHKELMTRDPEAAAKLRPSDHQRLIRALEVIDSTGISILEWQRQDKGTPMVEEDGLEKILLMPERSLLHSRINQRFDGMVKEGALDEVKNLMALKIDPSLPAMKAIGVRQFSGCLAAEYTLDEAIDRAKAATRQYAKRQSTWFNNQFGGNWKRL